ncbi:T9SS type A sorting domain-containing protein [Fulvivirga sp. 29W222]|uniref:T9SS type A sorting domain-containing protein n=1 Tax=Fulvivirga marina TaxID=2494733 RepID=A0A937G002_9BACT|nr:GEVED domain-containing protein [Fulvivirga marina]MBL6447987.1 T9SS type A sorting domain-containing protein [Fulvivirga marina]
MLKHLLVFFMALCSTYSTYAQVGPVRKCAAQEVFEEQNSNPKIAERRNLIEQHTRDFLRRKDKGIGQARTGVLTIPVIVHVIYSNAQENISDAQIQSQIDVLNEDYRKVNSDVSGVPSEFTATDMQIQFSLSQITRKSSTRTSWGTNDAMKRSSQGGVDPVDPAHNMNMWICNIGNDILGYAQFPGGPAATDGVVFSPQFCGSRDKQPAGETFYLSAPFDKGRTATHEVGHYLNLRHIWGDGDCSVDDFVSDTPTATAPNYNCPSYPSKSCSSNGGFTSDMFMNYMDYVNDACMFMFTAGQKARVDAVLEPGGARAELGSSTGGCSLAAPSGVASSNIGDNGFTLSWNAVSGAVSYDVNVGGTVTTVSGTSRTLTGLTAGTAYTCKVRANCDSGNGAYSSSITVTTTGGSCAVGPVTLTLVLDNYPSETSWTVISGGSTVASGSGYNKKGDTITETFNVGGGAYTFTINDSYGDGICCSNGNGSYTLRDANNNVIATGGDFGSSESVNYCTEGNDTSAPVYCNSKGNSTSDEWIQSVQIGSINNNSGSNGGYADFTSLSTSVNPGSSYNITITPAWAGTVYSEAYTVWVDYNQDGDFADPGEQVYSRNKTTSTSISGSFTVPSSALSGATRMRVSMKYNGNSTSCEIFSYGEVEDYTIVVGGTARSVQVAEKSDVGLYPNPAYTTHATVRFSIAGDSQDVDLTVFDSMGRSVYRQIISQVSGSHDETIDISSLEKGLYHVVIRGRDINHTKKLLVK